MHMQLAALHQSSFCATPFGGQIPGRSCKVWCEGTFTASCVKKPTWGVYVCTNRKLYFAVQWYLLSLHVSVRGMSSLAADCICEATCRANKRVLLLCLDYVRGKMCVAFSQQ